MLPKNLFQKPKNTLESAYEKLTKSAAPDVPSEMCTSCPECRAMLFSSELNEHDNVCPRCGHHFRINSRQRINMIADENSFSELFIDLRSKNVINFPNYDKKLKHAYLDSAEKEGVVCGTASIGGYACCLFVMEPYFMMGSMGTVVGEKITRLFEYATERHLPVIGFTVSGGARMQEGILSLMQMAKTSGAVKRHSDEGGLYIAVLTDPTTGGVTASFAMEADITLAEPKALIGFAGPRVIEQTIRQKLPNGFQRSEFQLDKGFVDAVVPRTEQKQYLTRLLAFHAPEQAPAQGEEADPE
jgi:acetyl-CoA carboxylase carboxyl transferase beta subunit